MKYVLYLSFLVSCVTSSAYACWFCIPASTCPPNMCMYIAGQAGYYSCSCMTQCPQALNCFATLAQKNSSGKLEVSCAGPAAIYGPFRPLTSTELPGTVGIDVRVLQNGTFMVDRVLRGSPADLAGVRRGDRLNSINETRAPSLTYREVIKTNPGELVRVKVIRNGKVLTYHLVAVRLDFLSTNKIVKQTEESAKVSQIGLTAYPQLSEKR